MELVVIYVGGMHFGEQCVLAAVGVNLEGRKHVLALREGVTENAEAAKDLLEHLVSHGFNPEQRRSFVIDGSKALQTAINVVFSAETLVQRCRNRKLLNVLARLPRAQRAQTASVKRAAWRLNEKEGLSWFRRIAGWSTTIRARCAPCRKGWRSANDQSAGCAPFSAPMSGHQQHRGQPAFWSTRTTRRLCHRRPGMPKRWSAAALRMGIKDTPRTWAATCGH